MILLRRPSLRPALAVCVQKRFRNRKSINPTEIKCQKKATKKTSKERYKWKHAVSFNKKEPIVALTQETHFTLNSPVSN